MEKNNEPDRTDFFATIHPEAKEVATWKYLWKNKRLMIIRSILTQLRERPLFVIILGSFVFHPSFSMLIAVLIAFLLAHLINELLGQIGVIINQNNVFQGAVLPLTTTYDDLVVSKFSVSEYMNDFNYTDMSYFLVESFQKLIPFKNMQQAPRTLNDTVAVYVFDTDQAILENVSSYPAPFRQSYIIFDHAPDECGFFQRFMILHEVAHTVGGFAKISFYGQYGFPMMLISLMIFFWIYNLSLLVFGILLLYYALGFRERFVDQQLADLKDEVLSDTTALMYLDENDLKKLAEKKDLPRLLNDTSLSEYHNNVRIKLLEENIGRVLHDQDPLEPDLPEQKWLMKKPSIFLLSLSVLSLFSASFFLTLSPNIVIKLLALLVVAIALFLYSHIKTARNASFLRAYLDQFSSTSVND